MWDKRWACHSHWKLSQSKAARLTLHAAAGTQNPVADEVNDGIQYQHIILEQSLQPPDLMFLTSLKALPLVSIPTAQVLSSFSACRLFSACCLDVQ